MIWLDEVTPSLRDWHGRRRRHFPESVLISIKSLDLLTFSLELGIFFEMYECLAFGKDLTIEDARSFLHVPASVRGGASLPLCAWDEPVLESNARTIQVILWPGSVRSLSDTSALMSVYVGAGIRSEAVV